MNDSNPNDALNTIPQEILDRLTRFDMPKVKGIDPSEETIRIGDYSVPVYRCESLVLGSGAAGMRAAVELKRRNNDVLVVSTGLFAGTSACSGSDKQTLYTASTDYRGDNFIDYAASLCAGGAMNFSTAYVEALGSIDAIGGLQFMGLPLPCDENGAILRYQTDHDEAGRATSCGPRTSKLMVKVLFEEALTLGVRILPSCSGIRIVKQTIEGEERVCGLIAVHRSEKRNPFGVVYIHCEELIIATGGPGELYRDSVYPRACYGGLGVAIEAGLSLCNLTESQFGIGSPRSPFPWNLSGTYVQVMPRIYSVDAEGRERNFLARYYRNTAELASNTFRKGYQWPFHATRMLNYGSSLLDLAVLLEQQAGRRVYMDFLRNPDPVSPGDEFSLEALDADVHAYLKNNDALLELPIDRLKRMNPLAIELYLMHGTDLRQEPLEFAMNNQHMNGGILIDDWGRTSLKGCFAIGEAAGSHGVTRPGGAALNSGQVFGKRVAVRIARDRRQDKGGHVSEVDPVNALDDFLKAAGTAIEDRGGLSVDDVRDEIQARMSDTAGILCDVASVASALKSAKQLVGKIRRMGIRASSPLKVADAFRWEQLARASEAILTALDYYVAHGGGSRGARAICSEYGTQCPEASQADLSAYRFIEEQAKDQQEKLVVKPLPQGFEVIPQKVDMTAGVKREFFEKGWGRYLIEEG